MKRRMRFATFWVSSIIFMLPAVVLADLPRPIPAAAVDLSGLLHAFAKAPGLFARFHEEKHIALLTQPLLSSGQIFYAPQGLLARHTLKPELNVLVVEPNRVRAFDGKHWENMDLNGKPVVRLFVESFVRILQGDAEALRKLYDLDFKSDPKTPGRWTLRLKPKIAPLNKVIERMELRGAGLVLQQMQVFEVGGDDTLTEFRDVDLKRSYTDAEKTKWFYQPAGK